MNYLIHRFLLFFSMLAYTSLVSISVVYNFRISQITKQPIFEEKNHTKFNTLALAFDQFIKKKQKDIHQNYIGGLGSFIYNFGRNYFRTDFAFSHIQEKIHHKTTFSSFEMDDVLFTLGRNFIKDSRNVVTVSVFLGVPTHRIFRLIHPEFGYGQVGTGIQLDGSYKFNHISALLYGARYIHFVPRSTRDSLDQKYTFSIGNVADLLLACKNNWGMHGFEFGYTSRFQFGASIFPNFDDIVSKVDYIRSNFYAVYKYKFLINKVQNRLLFYISYGFDHGSRGDKYVVTLWTSWNIKF